MTTATAGTATASADAVGTAAALEVCLPAHEHAAALRADAYAGLTDRPKWLPPTWLYDERGSALFEEITRLPEYFPTRVERALLTARATEIAALTGADTLVELGSGSCAKARLLLDAIAGRSALSGYVGLDVSASALGDAVATLAAEYPRADVRGVVGDFQRHLGHLPADGRRLVAFLGGTVGNLLPAQRARFLRALRATLRPGEWLLLGTGLVTDPDVLVPAYDDAAGVTAAFNRNVLTVLNHALAADFDPAGFRHVARWDTEHEWIEMRLRALRATTVRLPALDLTVRFAAGEDLRTEVSAKFRRAGLARELAAGGFALRRWWPDPAACFSLTLAQAT